MLLDARRAQRCRRRRADLGADLRRVLVERATLRLFFRAERERAEAFAAFPCVLGTFGQSGILPFPSTSPVYTRTWYSSNSLLIAFGSPFRAEFRRRRR